MPTTDTSEKGLESLIVASLVGPSGVSTGDPPTLHESLPGATTPPHYVAGKWQDYDRDHAVDTTKLLDFLESTQPKVVEEFNLSVEGPVRHQFLDRSQGEIAKRGVVDVLRKGIKHGPSHVDLLYGTPTPGNLKAAELHKANVFSVTRQLRYSKDQTQLALDLALFINGLPVATFELKNKLTQQTVEDAINQYKRAHPLKHDTFVLDFVNDADTIQEAFEPYYRTTILSEATDPNKIHDLKSALDARQVYAWPDVERFVQLYLGGADRDQLDPILDACVAIYKDQLDEDAQVDFKSNAKVFVRTYSFLATVLPYTIAEWEKLSIFLNFLIPKLPAPKEDGDKVYQNARKNSDKQNARIEHDKVLERVIVDLLNDHTELFKQFMENPQFKKWLSDTIFASTYKDVAA